ncbi:MAG: catalase [Pseudomonadota bacterium]|nr:catalase [Pseudomonadota bacterium]
MASKKKTAKGAASSKAAPGAGVSRSTNAKRTASPAGSGTTASGPSNPPDAATTELAAHAADQQALAEAVPYNAAKPREYGLDNARNPTTGSSTELPSAGAGASTLSEKNETAKTRRAALEPIAVDGGLDRVRVNDAGQMLTTNQGVPVSDNQNSLKAGLRGPTLLEDFILREKITHFDHERIPERIVHARGSAAHGFFEAYEALGDLTRAAPFSEAGKITPVFVRFSTVAGERGSADTARDVRGFAVKFYTDEGNWDLVGNNIPVFFIQDAMKFPDLIHAVKPEPHNAIPQAASAHDTFWDFASLMPESTHMLMWVMSDRAIPRSYRMMQGFGVHTFRLVNQAGKSTFCKFHWTPRLGTHSLVWDEAAKLMGADPDFHRRDLWEAIESGNYPEWELGLQTFSEAQAEKFSFDVLDATKIVPEELVPVKPVGRMVLNRNPDNFFAETEQVAFCTAHVVPGIDFSNDPLLHGRIHSYVDTQITRLGGANFHEIPINAPVAPVHNNQRDGLHRQAIPRGRVAYEPNSLGGGCPFQAGKKGFVTFPPAIAENNTPVDKVRGKPEKFAEHYNQARLFFDSQTPVEKNHIIGGFRFELSKVTVPAIRERMVSSLRNVSEELAGEIAHGLGLELPDAMPRALKQAPAAEVKVSPALSLTALPGEGGIETRRIAIFVANGVEPESITALLGELSDAGAVPRLLGSRLGTVRSVDGEDLEVDATLENSPSVLFDALVLPDGDEAIQALAQDGHCMEFLKDQYRHGKSILALGTSAALLDEAGIPKELPGGEPDPGVILAASAEIAADIQSFIAAVARHRHPERDRDPPLV